MIRLKKIRKNTSTVKNLKLNIGGLDAVHLVHLLNGIFSETIDLCFPLKNVTNKKSEIRWFNSRLREISDEVFATTTFTQSELHWEHPREHHKISRKRYGNAMRDAFTTLLRLQITNAD